MPKGESTARRSDVMQKTCCCVRIKGVVVPSAWDSQGRITQVAVSGADEREYRVRREGSGLELEEMLHLAVEVKGHLISDGCGGQEILVKEFCKAGGGL